MAYSSVDAVATTRFTDRGSRGLILALLLLFLCLSLIYNAIVPPGEGPDEPGHFGYVLFLAREGRLPVQRAEAVESDVPGEGHQPPLAYLLATPAVLWLAPEERRITMSANPDFVWSGGDQPAAFNRGSREYWPWNGVVLAWHLARAVSGVWGVLTVYFVYLAARSWAPQKKWLPLFAAALVAFNPQFLFASALVSNDGLLAALGAALLWRCLSVPEAGLLRDNLILGLLFGAALLTKQSALLLGPLLLWAGWRVGYGDLRRAGLAVFIWGSTALLVAGWWYLRNWQLYGDPFGLAVFRAEFASQPFTWNEPAAWRGGLKQLYGSFWARFGWMSLHPPAWVSWFYAGLGVLAGSGLLRLAIMRRSSYAGRLWAPLSLTVAMALAWTISFALTAGLVAWQGRMLFPAIGAIALLLAAGLQALVAEGRRVGRLVLPAGAALMGGLALGLPFAVIGPAYEWYTLPPREALAGLGQPIYARYARSWKEGVELRGWQQHGAAQAGGVLQVRLTWHALEPIPENWTVFVHLIDEREQLVAESNSRPQHGAFPMTRWTTGDWVADIHRLELPADLPPGRYRLRVGLYLPEDGERREAVWASDGSRLGDSVELGMVTIR